MIDPSVSAHYTGDCRKLLKQLPAGCVQTCITSPPYWGLRDYDTDGQIGLEDTPEQYVDVLVEVFEGVWRVLREDGTLWLNLGDCYVANPRGPGGAGKSTMTGTGDWERRQQRAAGRKGVAHPNNRTIDPKVKGRGHAHAASRGLRTASLKHKDLVGMPWMAAFALRAAGWYLRCDVIWSKPNPLPESVTDRPTKAHEYLFLLSKSASYYYDRHAIAEPTVWDGERRNIIESVQSPMPGAPAHTGLRKYKSGNKARQQRSDNGGNRDRNTNQTFGVPWEDDDGRRNKRSVWTVTPMPYTGAHFATFPPDLIEPCVLACSRPGDLVLDPFFGSGTTGLVAEKHERRWIGFDINPKYAELAKERTAQRSLPLSRRDG